MNPSVSVIIPAWNEESTIATTLQAIRQTDPRYVNKQEPEIIVVDDGSTDRTFEFACRMADSVIRNERNEGKGAAMTKGCEKAKGDILVFIDADLGDSAVEWRKLIEPIEQYKYDMTIAILPAARRKGGFGFVKRLAKNGIYWLSGYETLAPLSGQRAIRKTVLAGISNFSSDFGVEVGMTIDAARAGFKIGEIEVPFYHRESGRNWTGFYHRGKQFTAVTYTLWKKWKKQ